MRVFVTGATGVLGHRVVSRLVRGGHTVTGLARTPEKAARLEALGATPVSADLFDAHSMARALEGHQAVCNLATSIPPVARAARPSAWEENERIRRYGSEIVAAEARHAGAEVLVQEALAFAYPDSGAEWIDESTPLDVVPVNRGVLVAESNALEFAEGGGRGVVLRFGNFYGPDAIHTQAIVKAARRGISPLMGADDAYWPSIHLDDAAAAVEAALSVPTGVYNVNDEPVTRTEYAAALAAAVGRRKLRRPPTALARLGGEPAMMLTRSIRPSTEKFRAASTWTPHFPSVHEGYPEVVADLD